MDEETKMKQYLDSLKEVMETGYDRNDRTGVGTRAIFAKQMQFNLQDGFPAVTTKKLAWLGVVSELLWMIEGSGDERRLAEIRYGKERGDLSTKRTIWSDNAMADYWVSKAKYLGDLGRVYGVQWRSWQGANGQVTDQLGDVIERIKTKPWDRRHIVSAWNPGELDEMALPPCHIMFQFFVADGKLSTHILMRSTDSYLGLPFNIASYALLTHMVAQICSLDVNELVITCNDLHIYNNHFDQVNLQISRDPLPLPNLWLNPDIKDIDNFTMDDIKLLNYESYPPLPAPMAV
jgi:thymidylate synthase